MTRPLKGLVAGAVLCSAAFAATAAGGTGVNPDFALGRSNAVNAVTALSGSTNGTQFHIQNLNTGKSAAGLGIKVAAGRPPLIVNSATKVEHLNADFLDGVNASGFQPRTEQECPNGSAIASITITGDSQCTKSWEVPLSATGIPGSFAGRFIDGTPLDVEFRLPHDDGDDRHVPQPRRRREHVELDVQPGRTREPGQRERGSADGGRHHGRGPVD